MKAVFSGSILGRGVDLSLSMSQGHRKWGWRVESKNQGSTVYPLCG